MLMGISSLKIRAACLTRRVALTAIAVATMGAFLGERANAQAYPSKPITIVCAQPPGSGPDTMLRLFAEVMGRNMGQRILVVNQPGAGGALAATTVAKAAPDGYTLLLVLGGMHTIAAAFQKMPFDPIKDFTFISLLYSSSGVLLVPPNSPATDFAGLVKLVKEKGANATYGSPAIGSPGHLQGALLAEKIGAPAKNVSYRGGSQLMMDLTGGLIDYAFLSTVQSIAPVQQHQARALAVGTESRVDALPGVPTLKELGYGDVAVDSWFGIGGPAGLPPEIVKKIGEELVAAAKDPSIIARAKTDDVALIPGSQDAIMKLLAADRERLGGAVKRLGIKAE
jgi:tripartite-type tricarboxylate transporter receptor subunit TctC